MKRAFSALPVLASVVAMASCTSGPANDGSAPHETARSASVTAALTSGDIVTTWHDSYTGNCVCNGISGGGYAQVQSNTPRSHTFSDPVPAGNCVTGVSVTFLGTQCGANLGFRLNGTDLGSSVSPSSTCSCSDCSGSTVTASFPGGIAGYVYGGTNTLLAYTAGSYTYVSQTTTSLTYEAITATTTTTLASVTNPAAFGQSVTLSAHVAASAGSPTGSVTFSEGATPLGSGTVNAAGDATFTTSALGVGSHDITATYVPNVCSFPTSASGIVTEVVNAATTTTGIATSQSSSVVGGNVIVTATVAPVAPGAGVPGGSVTFFDGATSLGSSNVDVTGHATYATTGFAVGDHVLTATYAGTASYTTSTSATTTQTVSQDSGSTVLVADTNPSTFGGSVTFTATVSSGATGGVPTGNVVFKDGATTLATVALVNGSASYTTSTLAGGSHTITASYGGDTNHAAASDASVPEIVNVAPTTTALASSPSPSKHGQSVTLTATPSSMVPGTLDGTVAFTEGATTLGTSAIVNGKATFTTAAFTTGSHDIVATYSGNGNFGGSPSSTTTQTVDASDTTTTLVASANPSLFGSALGFTATVADVAPGAGTPTGSVTFKDDTTTLGTAALVNGSATYTTSSLAVGTHPITAVYGGATDHAGSTSTSLAAAVSANAASAELVTSPSPSIVSSAVTLIATFGGNAGTPTGLITFVDDTNGAGTTLGTADLVGGVATFSVSTLAIGNHTLVARFPGNGAYAAATASAAQVVGKDTVATTVTSSANPSAFATPPAFTATLVSSTPGATGNVDFYDGAIKLGTGTVDASGTTTFQSPSLLAGGHVVFAVYAGDDRHLGSTSRAYVQNVARAPSTTPVADAGAAPVADAGAVTSTLTLSGSGCSFGGSSTNGSLAGLAGFAGLVVLRARRRRARSAA